MEFLSTLKRAECWPPPQEKKFVIHLSTMFLSSLLFIYLFIYLLKAYFLFYYHSITCLWFWNPLTSSHWFVRAFIPVCVNLSSILHRKNYFFILHIYFYKILTSVHLLYTIFYIYFLILFYTSINLFFFFFLFLSFFLSLPFPLSFLPLSLMVKTQKLHHKHSINTKTITSTTTPLQSRSTNQNPHHRSTIKTHITDQTQITNQNPHHP